MCNKNDINYFCRNVLFPLKNGHPHQVFHNFLEKFCFFRKIFVELQEGFDEKLNKMFQNFVKFDEILQKFYEKFEEFLTKL